RLIRPTLAASLSLHQIRFCVRNLFLGRLFSDSPCAFGGTIPADKRELEALFFLNIAYVFALPRPYRGYIQQRQAISYYNLQYIGMRNRLRENVALPLH